MTEPLLFCGFASFVGLVFALAQQKQLIKLFDLVPPVIWIYALPAVASTLGWVPRESPLYPLLSGTILPAALVLLLLGTDLRAVARLGLPAVTMTLVGATGIVLGAPLALALFGGWLPAEAWAAFGALSGSWTGGFANMIAVKESIGTPERVFGAAVAMDFLVGYSWTLILLFLARYQDRIDRWLKADLRQVDQAMARLRENPVQTALPLTLPGLMVMVGLAFGVSGLAIALGNGLPEVSGVLSHKTWGFILVTTFALGLSLTPVARLEQEGASRLGSGLLYLVVATLGAQGDLGLIGTYPLFLVAGWVWIGFHALGLLLVARLTRTPFFLLAVGSQANTGGVVTTPIVAVAYRPGTAPLGLLMAVLGNVIGTYAGLTAAGLCQGVARAMGWI
ncbi:DUF819 domain-containing protein [Candidatus Cyanaurora vandensis]|uniref:DUF819 family protein n=1 Tax=Candidatus Cyanaurora vandensis TaxID=2714958 RepID=UPI00257E7DB8|nr:DUF819 family protein [Candidatus Cyanaurora vandensis]